MTLTDTTEEAPIKKTVTVLIPAYNEAESLPLMARALADMADDSEPVDGIRPCDFNWEFLFVNDGSRDTTEQILRQLRQTDQRINFVSLSRNFGKENAMLAGMDVARGDAIVIMDADLQHPPAVISQMLARWAVDHFDDVYGKRRVRGREPWLRKLFTRVYYNMLERSTRIPVLPNVGDFRLLDRRCVDAIRSMRETERYTKGLYCWVGFRKTGVEFDQGDRAAGTSTFSPGALIRLAIQGITGFTTAPLRIATVMGLVVSLMAFVYLAITLAKTLIFGESVQGYPTLMCVILFLGGCQLLALGIIGEYIAKIFNETKHRPPYIIDNINGQKQ